MIRTNHSIPGIIHNLILLKKTCFRLSLGSENRSFISTIRIYQNFITLAYFSS